MCCCNKYILTPETYGEGVVTASPSEFFLSFFLDEKTSAPDVFTTCSFIPRAHFGTSLVIVSDYGYEIWRH